MQNWSEMEKEVALAFGGRPPNEVRANLPNLQAMLGSESYDAAYVVRPAEGNQPGLDIAIVSAGSIFEMEYVESSSLVRFFSGKLASIDVISISIEQATIIVEGLMAAAITWNWRASGNEMAKLQAFAFELVRLHREASGR
jgi:hypothetical protein